MDMMINLFDAMWSLMWLPLFNLGLDNLIVTCPLLLMIVTSIFGLLFKIFSIAGVDF